MGCLPPTTHKFVHAKNKHWKPNKKCPKWRLCKMSFCSFQEDFRAPCFQRSTRTSCKHCKKSMEAVTHDFVCLSRSCMIMSHRGIYHKHRDLTTKHIGRQSIRNLSQNHPIKTSKRHTKKHQKYKNIIFNTC